MDITIGGREIPLYFSTYEMIAIQKDIGCTAAQLRDEVFGLKLTNPDDSESWAMDVATDMVKTEKLGKLIRILGNAGLEEAGKEPDLTEKWILRRMKPGRIVEYAIAASLAIAEGNRSEVAEEMSKEKEKGPVDEMVEEENRKKAPGK